MPALLNHPSGKLIASSRAVISSFNMQKLLPSNGTVGRYQSHGVMPRMLHKNADPTLLRSLSLRCRFCIGPICLIGGLNGGVLL